MRRLLPRPAIVKKRRKVREAALEVTTGSIFLRAEPAWLATWKRLSMSPQWNRLPHTLRVPVHPDGGRLGRSCNVRGEDSPLIEGAVRWRARNPKRSKKGGSPMTFIG